MGRRGYPPEFRRRVLDLVEAGRAVAGVARDLGISAQTICTWRRQDRIDKGLEPGLTSGEKAELLAARRATELTLGRGIAIGCHAVELLMRRAGLQGFTGRPKHRRGLRPEATATDLVDRRFARDARDVLVLVRGLDPAVVALRPLVATQLTELGAPSSGPIASSRSPSSST